MKKIVKKTTPFWAALFLLLFSAPAAAQWQVLEDMPMPLGAIDPGVLDGKIYVFGGKITELISSDTVWVYDPDEGWSFGGKMPDSLEAIIVEEYNGKLYLFGGHSHPDFVYRREVMTYDPATWQFDTVGYMPTAKAWFTSVVLGGKIYLLGGDDNVSGPSRAVDVFDPISGVWASGPPLNTGRAGLSADTLNGKIYVTGGGAGTTAFNTAEIYEPGGQWIVSPAMMNTARGFHSCKNVGGKLYVVGGAAGFSTPFLNTTEYFDPQTGVWVDFDDLNFARRELGAAVLGGDFYVLGGMTGPFGNANFHAKVERHEIVSSSYERKVAEGFDFQLRNSPNPFHSTTRMEFAITERAKVELDIFDVNGKKVATLLDEVLYPGEYEASWNGSGLPAGVYLYQLSVNGFTVTRRCVLTK